MDLAGSKLKKKRRGTLQEGLSAPTSAFAVEQLKKMGWTEGTGLGKKRNGITTHIKVKKRAEGSGLGSEKRITETLQTDETWWKDSVGDTLSKLASLSSKKKKKKSKRKKHFTDEELFEATGGARFGMRAVPTRNLGKWRRTEDVPQGVKKSGEKRERDEIDAAPVEEKEKESKRRKKDKKKKCKSKGADEGETDSERTKKDKKKEKKKKKSKE